jgi:hypothetical protein
MTIVDDLTATQFELICLRFQPSGPGGIMECWAEVRIYNASGVRLGMDIMQVNWTEQEWTVINNKIAEKKTQYATATGWTEYVRLSD